MTDKSNGSPAPRERLVPVEIDRTKHAHVLEVWNDCLMNCETLEMVWPQLVKAIASLPSEKTAIGPEPRGCPTPGACSAVAELADLKQRLLPQFQGRAERAEKEHDELREQSEGYRQMLAGVLSAAETLKGQLAAAELAAVNAEQEERERIKNLADACLPETGLHPRELSQAIGTFKAALKESA